MSHPPSNMNLWLPIELHRRISLSPLRPIFHCSEGGTGTAVLLSDRLLEDMYDVNTLLNNTNKQKNGGNRSYSGEYSQGFQGFIKAVMKDAQ